MDDTASDEVGRHSGDQVRPTAAIRNLTQYAALCAGAILVLLGWYGISGTAQVAEQIPYLASATVPGAALVIAGAILIAGDRTRRSEDRAAEQMSTLFGLLTVAAESPAGTAGAEGVAAATPGAGAEGALAVPGGQRYHRPGCTLVAGKAAAEPVGVDAVEQRQLEPCPICEPPRPTT